MKCPILKRLCAVMIGVVVLCSCIVVQSSAATIQNLYFYPSTPEEGSYIHKDNGSSTSTVEGQKIRYTDHTSSVVYKVPLNTAATKANLVVTVSQNYVIEYSSNDTSWTLAEKAPGLAGVDQCSNSNKKDLVINCMPLIKQGVKYVYFRLSDQTTGSGWGGVLWRVLMTYADYSVPDTSPATQKVAFSFIPSSTVEKRYLIQDTGSQVDTGSRMRFCDEKSYVTYRIPYDSSKDAILKMVLSSNYVVRLSTNNQSFKQIANEPTGIGVKEMGHENKRVINYDLKSYKGKSTDFLYLKIADQTTDAGWGAGIWMIGLNYGKEAIYNPFDLTGIVNNSVVVKPTSAASATTKKTTASTSSNSNTTESAIESSVTETTDTTVIDTETSTESTASQTDTQANSDTDQKDNGTVGVVLIIVVAVLLVGGAVVQYVLMEKKSR